MKRPSTLADDTAPSARLVAPGARGGPKAEASLAFHRLRLARPGKLLYYFPLARQGICIHTGKDPHERPSARKLLAHPFIKRHGSAPQPVARAVGPG